MTKLWTFQTTEIAQELSNGNSHVCFPEKSEELYPEGDINDAFMKAYDWLSNDMSNRQHITRPEHITYPIWAWHTHRNKNKKPDRRTRRNFGTGYVLIELDVDSDRIVLTDWENWHNVLNDSLLITDEEYEMMTDTEFDYYYNNCTIEQKIASWQKIYNVENSEFIQATFWELRPEDVVNIDYL